MTTRTKIAASVACCVLAFLAACGSDTSGPNVIPLRKVTLEAVSSRSFATEVGTVLGGQPSVRARDLNGKPAAGVIVEFLVSGGAGIARDAVSSSGPGMSYSSVTVVSDTEGIAKLGTWRMPSQPGMTSVSAQAAGSEAITFNALAVTGPPAIVRKEAGDGQFIRALESAIVRPQIRVLDFYLNPVAGVPVTFAVASGGGSVTGGSTYTNAAGIASVGSWIVGSEGQQTLSAKIEGIEREQIFTAMIADTPIPCGTVINLPIRTLVQTSLSPVSCENDGKHYDIFSVNLAAGAYSFSVTATDFDPQIELVNSQNEMIGKGSSQLKTIAPGGVYRLRVTSKSPGSSGRYTLQYGDSEPVIAGCEDVFVTRGLSMYQSSGSMDCPGMIDRFGIVLRTGQALKVTVEDLSYSDHSVRLLDSSGQVVATGSTEGQWWIIIMNFVPKTDGVYYLEVTSGDEGAEYTLIIQ